MKSAISKPKTNAAEISNAGGGVNFVAYAEEGMKTAVTPMNPGKSGLFRVPPPQQPGIMTARQVGALRAAQNQISVGTKHAVEGYQLIRKMSDDMTTVKLEHDKTIAHYAKNDLKQLQSQHAVGALMESLRPAYMDMNQGVVEQRDAANGYQATFKQWNDQAADLMMLA
uniref:hypothetical protein n=1 Tax=Trichocoleus desertorum TaxID=1481672 RepID=UPI0025B5E4B3|nr:hypothetical protein [Trichocoleus desertorum]